MTLLRSSVYFAAMIVWTVILGVLYLPLLALPSRWMTPFVRLWARGIIGLGRVLCGIRWQLIGAENLPTEPCIIAAKHQSAWETLFLPLLMPNFAYVLKRELLFLPFVGWYMMKSRMIAINRKAGASALKHILKATEEALAAGQSVIIFPEGTRVAPLADATYHHGIAALYARFGDSVPVIPIALNSGLVWPRNSFEKRSGLVTVQILPAIPKETNKRVFLAELKQQIDTASNRLCESPPV